MTIRHTLALLLLSSCAALAFMPAYADIGRIGSPVKGSTPAPREQAPAQQSGAVSDDAGDDEFNSDNLTPLLVIRFNQYHVNFGQAVRQAVETTSKAKPGATYDVVSLVPIGGDISQNQHIAAAATDNVNAVVQKLRDYGVPLSQIHVHSKSSEVITAQEVDIYVE